jgi:hypothetical protein
MAGNRTGLLFMIPSKILVKQPLLALLFTSSTFLKTLSYGIAKKFFHNFDKIL